MYIEHQIGGLCRMHALNAYFQGPKISQEMFAELSKEFDKEMKVRYGYDIKSDSWDIIPSDQCSIVCWILKKFRVWSKYQFGGEFALPPNFVGDFIFAFSADHIWGVKIINGEYWKLDSLVGTPVKIDVPRAQGFIYPVDMKKEFYIQIEKVQDILRNKDIKSYLECLNKNKLILGELEVLLSCIFSILEWHKKYKNINSPRYQQVYDMIANYKEFQLEFTKGNYLNLELINKYIPDILKKIIQITKQ